MHTLPNDLRETLTAHQALSLLVEGNHRFVSNLRYNRHLLQQVNNPGDGYHPIVVALSCADAHMPAELIFDQGLRDVLSLRLAGNLVNDDVLSTMEHACQTGGAKLIVVLGHTKCGTVKQACERRTRGALRGLLDRMDSAVQAVERRAGRQDPPDAFADLVAVENARHQVHSILERSTVLARSSRDGRIGIAAAMYSTDTGEVTFIEQHVHETQGADVMAPATMGA